MSTISAVFKNLQFYVNIAKSNAIQKSLIVFPPRYIKGPSVCPEFMRTVAVCGVMSLEPLGICLAII